MRSTVLCGLLVFAMSVPAIAAPEPKKPASIDDSAAIAEKLLDRIDIDERLDKIPLKDILDYLQKRSGLTFILDRRAFLYSGEGIADIETLESKTVSLPALKRVRIETALRVILDQFDADFYVAPDHIRITTTAAKDLHTGQAKLLPELHPKQDDGNDAMDFSRMEVVRSTPYVTASFRETAAVDALKDIASRAGRNVLISEAAAEKAKTAISVNLSNVAFETAAASIAEAAGLRAFRNGNVVVIVTSERAKQAEGESHRLIQGMPPMLEDPLEAKLKALEEKVKKLTEELEKSKK